MRHKKLFLSLWAFSLLSCNLARSSFPNVIVIAVDNLGVSQVNCSNHSAETSGIEILCQESVRFTHAYTTSPLAAPALTSVLTAQNPLTHGLRHNGNSFLSAKIETVAEVAHRAGVATSFFSGGAPLFRKLNIQQGFETFDDNVPISIHHLFRPFEKSVKLFESWLKDTSRQSFFSVFYVPDLQFTNTKTQNDLGESRNLTFESQFEEFDETLYKLIQTLKGLKQWDSTTLILVGLNSPEQEERPEDLSNLNLSSDRTQISLLIKPSQKPRDSGVSWSFDSNVSLIDVGATLFAVYDRQLRTTDPDFPAVPLQSILFNTKAKALNDRPLLIESSWGLWQGQLLPRYAIRLDQFLFVLDQKMQVYNSLIDRSENNPLRPNDSYIREPLALILKVAEKRELKLWPTLDREIFLKWSGLSDLWSAEILGVSKEVSFERLAHRLKDDPEISHLFTLDLLNQQNWPELERWAQGMRLKDIEMIAQRNLKKSTEWKSFNSGCLSALSLNRAQISDFKQCDDPLALSLLEWIFQDRTDQDEGPKKKFLRLYVQMRVDRKMAEANWALQGVWDLSSLLRGETPIVELMLALPETQKYRQQALRALTQAQSEDGI